MRDHKIIASILIVNFNNGKYLKKCINSVLNQSFKNREIIVFDDMSTDNSLEILRSFGKKIKFYINKTKTQHGSYNQMLTYYKGVKKTKGKFIFFLDSDDYFKKNKVEKLIKKFSEPKYEDIIFDLPTLKFKKKYKKFKFKQKKFLLSNWPRFTPQSCISIQRKYFNKIYKEICIKKYPTLWFDFRIAVISFLLKQDLPIYREYLTFYRQLNNSASKKYKTFSKNWWIRRDEAHKFYQYLFRKLHNKPKEKNFDQLITSFINFFIKKIIL